MNRYKFIAKVGPARWEGWLDAVNEKEALKLAKEVIPEDDPEVRVYAGKNRSGKVSKPE